MAEQTARQIPGHVLSAFQLDGRAGIPLGPEWDNGVRFGRVVVSEASWSKVCPVKLRATLPDCREPWRNSTRVCGSAPEETSM